VDTRRTPASATTTDGIVARLRERILSHELTAGTSLAQAELARQFGVSRIPVRDALRRLATEGLVDLTQRGSAVVAPLSLADLQELYELRCAVEPLASRLAVPHVGRVQRMVMARSFEQMQHAEDVGAWLASHATFHAQVYLQSGRPRAIALVENLRRLTERYLRVHLSHVEATSHLRDEHQAIMTAVNDGDPEAVETLVRDHLATAHDFILGHLLEHEIGHARSAREPGSPGTLPPLWTR
jgi:DNA-binding GntR family transcriptional regulator